MPSLRCSSAWSDSERIPMIVSLPSMSRCSFPLDARSSASRVAICRWCETEAIAGLVVDRGRNEKPDFVVMAQRLDAYPGETREPPDRHELHGVGLHLCSIAPPVGGESRGSLKAPPHPPLLLDLAEGLD